MKSPETVPEDSVMPEKTPSENETEGIQKEQEQDLSIYDLPEEIEHILRLQRGLQDAKNRLELFVTENDFKLYDLKRNEEDQKKLEGDYTAYMARIDAKFFSLASFVLEDDKFDVTPHEVCGAIRDALHDVVKFREIDIPSRSKVLSLITQSLSRLEEAELKDGNLAIFDLITETGTFGNDQEVKITIDFIIKNLPKIEQFLSSREPHFFGDMASASIDAHFESVIRALTVLANSSSEHHDILFGMINRLLKEKDTLKTGAHVLGGLLYCSDIREEGYNKGRERRDIFLTNPYNTEARSKKTLWDALEFYGVEQEYASIYAEKWTQAHRKRDLIVEKNLVSLVKLESETLARGITKRLTDNFGITEFSRYPESMLFKQDMERDYADRPYGVVLYPKTDWNGAFYAQKENFDELEKDFSNNPELKPYLIRIFECGSRKDVVRVLNDLDKRYGSKHKISFAIIGGHGTKDSIQLGQDPISNNEQKSDTRNKLTPKDLQGSRVHKIGGFFEPGASVILESCSTGQEEGIGQKLSEKFGLKVIAPTEPVGVDSIKPWIRNSDGKIDFLVDYGKRDVRATYGPDNITG
jgi:hypothetical protein